LLGAGQGQCLFGLCEGGGPLGPVGLGLLRLGDGQIQCPPVPLPAGQVFNLGR
jgi:hypothetical protein